MQFSEDLRQKKLVFYIKKGLEYIGPVQKV